MSLHAFADASSRGSYLLAAALLAPAELAATRSALRELRVPGARRVHLRHERPAERRRILDGLVAAGPRVRLYRGCGRDERVRAACLHVLVTELVEADATRLVVDSRGAAADARDRGVIARRLVRLGATKNGLVYEHLHAAEDPALWIADAAAWCYGAGREWRRRIEPLVERVVVV